MRPESGSQIAPNWPKIEKNYNDVKVFWHDIIVKFLWRYFVFLIMFSYWSMFHVNIITGCKVMTILFYKGLAWNPDLGNTTVWVLRNIWRLAWVRNTKCDTNVSNKMLLNAAKYQGYSFYHFWVIKVKPTGRGKITPTQIRVK